MRKVIEVTFKIATDRYPASSKVLLETLFDAERLGLIEDLEGKDIEIDSAISFYTFKDKDKKRGE